LINMPDIEIKKGIKLLLDPLNLPFENLLVLLV